MKIVCNTKQFHQAIQLTERMAGKQLSLPSLQGILLQASGKTIKLRATNLNVGIEVEIPAKVEIEGSVLIRGDVVIAIVGNSNSETITCEIENDNLVVQTTTSRTVIKSLPLEDFPTLPVVEGESCTVVNTVLQEAIKAVSFATATTDIKPEIASVFLYTEGSVLVSVATDSFRLAEKKTKAKNLPEIRKILIPFKNIPDILRVLDALSGDIQITYNKNQLSLTAGTIYFTTRLIDGSFPDYRVIVPKEIKTKVVVLKQELLNTLRLSTLFVDKFSQVSLQVLPSDKKVVLSSKNSDIGAAETVLSAAIEGVQIDIAFNLKYFLDVFQSIAGDSIVLEFTEANRPIIVRGAQEPTFMYLLMPTHR